MLVTAPNEFLVRIRLQPELDYPSLWVACVRREVCAATSKSKDADSPRLSHQAGTGRRLQRRLRHDAIARAPASSGFPCECAATSARERQGETSRDSRRGHRRTGRRVGTSKGWLS